MMILYFHHNLSCIYCLLSHTNEYDDITSLTPFLPLITYRYQVIDLILLWDFLGLLVMLILVQKENEQSQAYIFHDAYSESC